MSYNSRALPCVRLLSNIYPIKTRDSIEVIWVMHIAEVDLRPGKVSSRMRKVKYSF